MLEYKFIDECEDASVLRAILAKLKSGEEGSFPHMERHCEAKLMGMLSEKERRKVISLRSGPSSDEVAEAGASISDFIEKIRAEDQSILQKSSVKSAQGDARNVGVRGRDLPPVRGQKADKRKSNTRKEADVVEAVPEPAVRTPSSHVYDAPNYFRKVSCFSLCFPDPTHQQ
jgi:hypothetical protein